MKIINREGKKEDFRIEKLIGRVKRQSYHLDHETVDANEVAQKVLLGIYEGISSVEIDNLTAETAAYLTTKHSDYAILASRIAMSNLHKQTKKDFSDVIEILYKDNIICKEVYEIVQANADELDSAIIHERDSDFDYFAFKTLEKSYLWKVGGQVVERPQHLFMRLAVGIHRTDIKAALETYNLVSNGLFTHATPTLFNSGTINGQLSSCFLLDIEDSLDGIYKTISDCAQISKNAGGIGVNIHDVRAKGSKIGKNGQSDGIIPMLKVFNETARYVNQLGKRKGSIAIYLEPWHLDIVEFLDIRKNTGKEEMRARDLFTAMWIPDLFMERVKANSDWSLFCPNDAKGLSDTYGPEFNKLYLKYEKEGKARKTIKAQELWFKILDSQIETGTPYMLYKDAANLKSNQKNLGTIKSSNLCTEIIEYTSKDETAVCNLASICLAKFVNKGKFDHQRLYEIAKIVTRNLNKVIDLNYYPTPETRASNMKHRPIGIGVQGLADTFFLLRLPFDSDEAKQLNKEIFETIYFGALTASMELAKEGKQNSSILTQELLSLGYYESFPGSPASQGILQFDMWGVMPSARWNWNELKENIKTYGLRNSLLLAPMPTASTASIFGNTEAFEPITSNIYTRRVLSGEFVIINKYLLKDLVKLKLWNNEIKNRIVMANGSIQNIDSIPQELKDLYKTVWEISQKVLIDMSADRGAFICQSQSLNLFLENPNFAKLSSMHFYAWEKGLKTGMYYLRSKAAAQPIQITIDKPSEACSIDNKDCEVCSS